ncbi:hypothetical protein NIES267_36210 [Calothrix parasitica NIES-267]|uniref:Uncharacterized protein n=1 Tax=Calothrix parasitica NIES-267 TaxID=1973488 RepID=A0A1Z4LS96_9CYAN|nr:hypothetical protein NIES267_36210 [Calothrix parasitica NIES-267]
MSSASKGRYQSRLFNFFHKQSRRFGEGFGRSLRQLRVATSWSLEAFSKSIYLLLQKAADSAGTQLPGTAAEPRLELQSSEEAASDLAIIRVLENIETQYITSSTQENYQIEGVGDSEQGAESNQLSVIVQTSEQNTCTTANKLTSLSYSSQKIRGVASQLYSQNLVLVTCENEILDVLTPPQQQALENQIISEIANYWRSWRLSQENQETKLLSRANRFFKRLATRNDNPEERENKYLQINPATVASLDIVVANLETNTIIPVSRAGIIVRQRSGKLIQTVKTKINTFVYGNREVTVSEKQVIVEGNVEKQSKIKALISAALKYFYAEPESQKIKPVPPRRYIVSAQSNSPQLQSGQSQDDWLNSADLFGNGFPQLNSRKQALKKVSNKLENSKQIKDSSEKLFGRFQLPNWRTLRLKEKAGLQKQQNADITSQNSQKITISSTSELQNRSKTQTSESTEIEAKPEWIETKAEIVGYQKHPLEQILTWIDNTMLKIEEAFGKFATALQQFFRR